MTKLKLRKTLIQNIEFRTLNTGIAMVRIKKKECRFFLSFCLKVIYLKLLYSIYQIKQITCKYSRSSNVSTDWDLKIILLIT